MAYQRKRRARTTTGKKRFWPVWEKKTRYEINFLGNVSFPISVFQFLVTIKKGFYSLKIYPLSIFVLKFPDF